MSDEMKHDGTGVIYDEIVIGAGAAGLFYAAADRASDLAPSGCCQRRLILEKTAHAGQKLLMSGNGMCNITHGGSIKTFIGKYGENGRLIRSCLYRHNNIELMDMMERLGVHLIEREDGKIFPESMKARDVLDALTHAAKRNGWLIRCGSEVTSISAYEISCGEKQNKEVLIDAALADGTVFRTRKLVIACGGSSYPSTGSDGTFLQVLKRDLGVGIKEPRPALAPVYVQDFRFGGISGVSLQNVTLECGGHRTRGPMLITHKGFSGPAVLHMSQYARPGDTLKIDFIPDEDMEDVSRRLKSDAPGNKTGLANYIASVFSLPRSFVELLIDSPEKKMSMLAGGDFDALAKVLTASTFSVSGTGGWNEAMVTAGGVTLDSVDLRTMRIKEKRSTMAALPDIRIIGEVLDVNGDTGGYNLQFAYSSAMAARSRS